MWGRCLRLFEECTAERARREELTRRVDAQQTTIAFLCQRLNHVEAERALLLRHLTNIEFPVPRLDVTRTAAVPPVVDPADAAEALAAVSALGIFDDDPKHAPAGWFDDGTVNYGPRPARDPVK